MMRNLIMGLLLANLLLLAWERWIVAPDVEDPRVFAGATEARLVLIESAERVDAVLDVSESEGERCFRLGSFSSKDAAEIVGDRLLARGLPVDYKSGSGQVWVGHWVQLPNLPDDREARLVVDRLVSSGISDAYIYNREPTIDISLGFFRSREGLDSVLRVARGLGYQVEMTDSFRDGIVYWVGVRVPADQPPDLADLPVAQSNGDEAQIIRVEERSCPAPADREGKSLNDGAPVDDSLESPAREIGSPG
jgi:hypothetical protein